MQMTDMQVITIIYSDISILKLCAKKYLLVLVWCPDEVL